MVPGSERTMEERGTKQVKLVGRGGMRRITALLASALSGVRQPPLPIYGGKTELNRVTQKSFYLIRDITNSESHDSNGTQGIKHAEKIIIPYVEAVRDGFKLARQRYKGLLPSLLCF